MEVIVDTTAGKNIKLIGIFFKFHEKAIRSIFTKDMPKNTFLEFDPIKIENITQP